MMLLMRSLHRPLAQCVLMSATVGYSRRDIVPLVSGSSPDPYLSELGLPSSLYKSETTTAAGPTARSVDRPQVEP